MVAWDCMATDYLKWTFIGNCGNCLIPCSIYMAEKVWRAKRKLRNRISVNAVVGFKVSISLLFEGRHKFKSFVRHLPETISQNPFQPYSSDPKICMYFSGTSISSGRVRQGTWSFNPQSRKWMASMICQIPFFMSLGF